MIDKRIEFNSTDSLGAYFAEAIDITPRGGGLEKIAGKRHPEIDAYIRQLRPDPQYQYVLMTPMGSFEYWGMNVNSDLFPEVSLAHDSTVSKGLLERASEVARILERKYLAPFDKTLPVGNYSSFGHKTFLNAKRYRHHLNKDESIAYGDIPLAVWNPHMHRVEVISRHDRAKALRVGAQEIIADIDAARPRMISMGCRVPFDSCTLCGYISFRPSDRCDCLKYGGRVLPDGRVVAMVNFFPSFFDLSDVIVPAAKEAGVLEKVARVVTPGGYLSHSKAAEEKVAEIEKQVAPNTALQDTVECEPDLPASVLRGRDLHTLLATLAALGIVLKPLEFQTAALSKMGMDRYADELAARRMVFTKTAGVRQGLSLDGSAFDIGLASRLAPMIPHRSGFLPHLPDRIARTAAEGREKLAATRPAPDSEPLRKVASAYASYRAQLRNTAVIADRAVSDYPEFYGKHFFSHLLTDAMEKRASAGHAKLVQTYVRCAHADFTDAAASAWDLSIGYHSPARALITPSL